MDLDREFERACSAYSKTSFDDLSERDRLLVAIWAVEAEVNNGGFDQFFFNGSGDIAYYAPIALEKIGAHKMASIASRANAFFGPSGPSRSRAERIEQLEEIRQGSEEIFDELDNQFFAYPDDISSLLVGYLERCEREGSA